MLEKSPHLSWYEGPTLYEALNKVTVPKRAEDKPLRIPVQITNKLCGIGTVMQGKVEAGSLKEGKLISIAPFFESTIAKSI